MACRVIQSWTVATLVGAFLDLALAYLLLCGSVLAFFASNFLNFLGLRLPCACSGLFGDPGLCLQGLLTHEPTRRISSVQRAAKGKIPFDSIWPSGGDVTVKLLKDDGDPGGYYGDRLTEIDGEASCSSARSSYILALTAPLMKTESVPRIEFPGGNSRRCRSECKAKGVLSPELSSGLRRRRRVVEEDYAKFATGWSSDNETLGDRRKEMHRDRSVSVGSGEEQVQCDAESRASIDLCEEMPPCINGESPGQESERLEDKGSDFAVKRLQNPHNCGNKSDAVRFLEQALEEERAAYAALYLELEKERSAAATAADEAMGMILRLQKEKASIDMEARQYQRVIEEKAAYDEEEMNILKEIVLRREREKLVLEKEVEMYRGMMFFNENNVDTSVMLSDRRNNELNATLDALEKRHCHPQESTDDAMLILQQISESIEKSGTAKDLNICLDSVNWAEEQSGHHMEKEALPDWEGGKGIEIVDKNHADLSTMEFQEKGMMGTEEQSWSSQTENYSIVGKLEMVEMNGGVLDEESHCDIDSRVLDVHVINSEAKPCHRESGKENASPSMDSTSNRLTKQDVSSEIGTAGNLSVLSDHSNINKFESAQNIHRSKSDMIVPEKSQGKALFSSRRNSISPVDQEKIKLQTEVGRLNERLKIVQKGREKLSFPNENKEIERLQELQLLEEICSQLNEIRSMHQPSISGSRVSLPPSSKTSSKRRRCRSVSIHESTG